MFNGFKEETMLFYQKISECNSKANFNNMKQHYQTYVFEPLYELYYELSNVVINIDSQICVNPRSCISSPYTDARYNSLYPIKEYMYIRYKLMNGKKTDVPGFFFDASPRLIRYGLNVYNVTSRGISAITSTILEDVDFYNTLLTSILNQNNLQIEGKQLIKKREKDLPEPLSSFINCKQICICSSLENIDDFYTKNLLTQIENTYIGLAELYRIIKYSLYQCF